jgi:hypothetical protein
MRDLAEAVILADDLRRVGEAPPRPGRPAPETPPREESVTE